MNIRLVQIDGKLPNLALMKLAHWHRRQGHEVTLTRSVYRDLFDKPDIVYGSAIFAFSHERTQRLQKEYPRALIGGTGTYGVRGLHPSVTVEGSVTGGEYERYDYSDYTDYPYSIGFTQRGCRLRCKFCLVPKTEGKARSVNSIEQIWRGEPWPKKLHLLDNDFFGQHEWRSRVAEIKAGDFRVCLNQGINVRLIDDDAAAALSEIEYRDDQFQQRRLYTAWDNFGDEQIFFKGMDTLERNGIPAKHVMAYMLVGYDPKETWDRIFHRFDRMVERGIRPYPMVYDQARKDLKAFQRWAVTGLYRAVAWSDYWVSARAKDSRQLDLTPSPPPAPLQE